MHESDVSTPEDIVGGSAFGNRATGVSDVVAMTRAAASETPDKIVYRFLGDGERETDSLTYAELDRRARAVAVALSARCRVGDRVVLLFQPGLDFAAAFLGTLYAGSVAVPVAPPGITAATAASMTAIVADADPSLVLHGQLDVPGLDTVPALDMADAVAADANSWTEPAIGSEALAFLQYTSGSTGDPKGVMVTHANLLANQAQIGRVFAGGPDDVIVSWLPMHHDMGLVGGLLHAPYLRATAVLMPPTAFLRRPLRWLRAVSTYRGTVSTAPDFAYALCVDATERATGSTRDLALDSWRVACNGSEPVRADTLARFAERFGPHGFDPDAFCPSYGMAEATLLISGVPRLEPARTSRVGGVELVSCGPWQVDDLVVVRDGVPLPDGEEGELCVAGPNVARGYWRDEVASAATFGYEVGGRRYLRTGDLGIVRAGEVYVTGRAKDVVVVRGRNHHPADIEATVQAVDPRLVAGAGAVFDTQDGPVVVQTVRSSGADLAVLETLVRAAVVAGHGLSLAECVFVRPGVVPRTTSGKVRRGTCRAAYLAGTLPRLAAPDRGDGSARPTGPRARLVADVLGADVPAADLPLTALGLDSLRAMRLQQRLADECSVLVPLTELLGGMTAADLEAVAATTGPAMTGPATTRQVVPHGGLSYGQQALAYLTAASPTGARDLVIARAFALAPDVDVDLLAAAFTQAACRHPQLSSQITHDGTTFVRRERAEPPAVAVEDVVDVAVLRTRVDRMLDAPLDIGREPLFQAAVLWAEQTKVLVLRVSHLVADLRSLAVLAGEVALCYEALCAGRPTDLPPPGDFDAVVRREAAYVASEEASSAAREWGERLAGLAPLDWPSAPEQADTGAFAVPVELDDRTSARIAAVAAAHGTTPFAVLLGSLGLFLATLTGRRAFAVGVPFAACDVADRGAVGYLVNTLPLVLDLPDRPTLVDVVERSARALLDGMAHARVPLSEIVRHVDRARTTARGPFSVVCDWVDDPGPGTAGFGEAVLDLGRASVRVGDLRLEQWAACPPRPQADLDVGFTRAGRRIHGRFAFDRAAIDEATGRVLCGAFTDFIRRAVVAPDTPVGLTGDRARPAVLPAADDPAPVPITFGELFRRRVAQHPHSSAIAAPGRRWTYAELGRRVRGAATALPDLPVSPHLGTALVGLHLDDPVEFTIAALAAWTRGYGIVPLATDTPAPRLAFLVADCGVTAVVTDAAHRSATTAWAGHAVVVGMPPAPADTPWPTPATGVGPDQIAYVVYTSGTTGTPKGVPITYAQVHPLLAWQTRGLGAGPGMRLAQTLALTFDFGLQEIMSTLLFGGTLCFPEPVERYAAAGFAGFLRREEVNTLFATPTFLRELTGEQVDLGGIELLVLGGEPLAPAAVRAALPLVAPGCRVINGYGPTEASINCTMHEIDTSTVDGAARLPVGRCTGASRVYVLGPGGDLLPEGVLGEVCIGGPGVASGYLNRPEESAARFRPDPFVPGGRMYRTGDLGRVVGGELYLAGRMDTQVKVRGYRIEPGEVEAALHAMPGIRDAAVVVDRRKDPARLVAFVIRSGAADMDETGVRSALADTLPPHLVPWRIIAVETFPLSRHGKLDSERLLAAIPVGAVRAGPTQVAGLADTIAAIWCEVLDIETVDPDMNFFEAGGHSLALGAVVARMNERLPVTDTPLHAMFEYPTVRQMARYVERRAGERAARSGGGPDPLPPTRPLGRPRRTRGRQHALTDHDPSAQPEDHIMPRSHQQ